MPFARPLDVGGAGDGMVAEIVDGLRQGQAAVMDAGQVAGNLLPPAAFVAPVVGIVGWLTLDVDLPGATAARKDGAHGDLLGQAVADARRQHGVTDGQGFLDQRAIGGGDGGDAGVPHLGVAVDPHPVPLPVTHQLPQGLGALVALAAAVVKLVFQTFHVDVALEGPGDDGGEIPIDDHVGIHVNRHVRLGAGIQADLQGLDQGAEEVPLGTEPVVQFVRGHPLDANGVPEPMEMAGLVRGDQDLEGGLGVGQQAEDRPVRLPVEGVLLAKNHQGVTG